MSSNQSRPINVREISETRHPRIVSQRRLRRQQRIADRIYRRLNVSINNEDMLNRITNLSRQITNESLVNQFFNGFAFY